MPEQPPSRPRKTWDATLGEIGGLAVAFWPGLLIAAFVLRPDNPVVILASGALSAAVVAVVVRFVLMRVEGLRPTLRWMFPVTWITGRASESDPAAPPASRR